MDSSAYSFAMTYPSSYDHSQLPDQSDHQSGPLPSNTSLSHHYDQPSTTYITPELLYAPAHDECKPVIAPSTRHPPQTHSGPPLAIISFKRRNAPASPPNPLSSPSSSSSSPSSSSPDPIDPWACPYCNYIQRSHRKPDFRRHIQTHTNPIEQPQWVCCGVPVLEASALKLPIQVIKEPPFAFEGVQMVGGCRKAFSRRDALIRHLKMQVRLCYGDASSLYQPGNRK